jgi:hypothetical protein
MNLNCKAPLMTIDLLDLLDLSPSLGTYVGCLLLVSMLLLPSFLVGALDIRRPSSRNLFIRKCTDNLYIIRALLQCAHRRIVLPACLILALHIALFSTVT